MNLFPHNHGIFAIMKKIERKMRIKGGILLLVFLMGIPAVLLSQVLEPVKWSFEYVQLDDGSFQLKAICAIDDQWHVYATDIYEGREFDGPIPTTFSLDTISDASIIGNTTMDGDKITHYDPNFEMDTHYFEGTAAFVRNISVAEGASGRLNGLVEYMACDDQKCIFPDPVPVKIMYEDGQVVSVEAYDPIQEQMEAAQSGVLDPVSWSFRSESLGNDEYNLYATATIDEGWHVYSQHLSSLEGPLPTVFEWGEGIEIIGETIEGEPHVEYDPNFMMDLAFFEDTPDFVQKVKAPAGTTPLVTGYLDYMVCNDQMCLPPTTVDFTIDLATGVGKVKELDATGIDTITDQFKLPGVDLDNPYKSCTTDEESTGDESKSTGLWTIFLLGFGGGLVALFTPCVFPMIPLTVSFFTKGSENRKKGLFRAILYGFFIFFIYFAISIPFHIWKIDPGVFSIIATGVGMNLFFFVIFVVFAISFFGYFEIQLPQSWANKADKASNAGGLIGMFFMALTLVVVSFSCTGPILGSVLAKTISDGPTPLSFAMGGFGVALGLPFALFAMFPSWLNNLPKSGGWLNSVKVVLGFAEVALAVKFLSNADLVKQWNLVHRETFFLIWAVIALLTGIYLLGKIKFPHDSPIKKLKTSRIILALVFIGFGVYLLPGILPKPPWEHKLVAGFPPPTFYSWYNTDSGDDGDHKSKCPLDLDCTKDFDEARDRADVSQKPIFIDFTGWACVNCRRMEENVWIDDNVYNKLSTEFEVVSLYVDDKRELDEDKKGVVEIVYDDGETKLKAINTIGDRWTALEILSFENATQPLYAVISPDGQLMSSPVGYTPDSDEYNEWLQCSLDAYEEYKTGK